VQEALRLSGNKPGAGIQLDGKPEQENHDQIEPGSGAGVHTLKKNADRGREGVGNNQQRDGPVPYAHPPCDQAKYCGQ